MSATPARVRVVGGRGRPQGQRKGGRAGDVGPYFMAAVATALLAFALPSFLRPPQQPPSTSAELSPDAPPDEQQDSIIASLSRGSSGVGVGEVSTGGAPPPPPPGEMAEDVDVAPVPDAAPAPRACPHGFGQPPRQVESLYSAPCAVSWQGDNGGATSKGVTATQVNVAWVPISGYMNASYRGPVPTDPQPDESNADRTWRVFQQYFNTRFQFWGRRIQFYVGMPEDPDPPAQRAAVATADEEYDAFAIHSDTEPGLVEGARRKLVSVGGDTLSGRVYAENEPYVHGWRMDATKLMGLAAEYVCKQLAGKPARHAGGKEQNKPRKFGIIVHDGPDYGSHGGDELPGMLRQRCGIDAQVISYSPPQNDAGASSAVATAIASFHSNEVTSIIGVNDLLSFGAFMAQADQQSYMPEWVFTGGWLLCYPTVPNLFAYSRTQMAHAFGICPEDMQLPPERQDFWRAYKEIDPSGTPGNNDDVLGDARRTFAVMLQIANGIQMAGPNLTPATFQEGLRSMGSRASEPEWSIGGGYGPGDHTYADNVAEIWWDNTAPNPETGVGAWTYSRCGRRWYPGDIPEGDPDVFQTGCVVPP